MAESSSRDSHSLRSEAAKRRRLDEELLQLLDAESSTGSSASSSSDSSSSRDDDDDLTLYEFMFEYLFSPPEQLSKVESYLEKTVAAYSDEEACEIVVRAQRRAPAAYASHRPGADGVALEEKQEIRTQEV
ncbi:hypothetical protein MRX96_055770 [Rhipicephalus microplus]